MGQDKVCVEYNDRRFAFCRVKIDIADKSVLVAAVAEMGRAESFIKEKDQADVGCKSFVSVGVGVGLDLRLPHFFER